MKAIIFNDKDNFDGCLSLVSKSLPKGKKRFWNYNKYIPFLIKKIEEKDKQFKNNINLKKTFIYTGRYNSKIIYGFKHSCLKKMAEFQDIIDREKSLLEDIRKSDINNEIKLRVENHVSNIFDMAVTKKDEYKQKIDKHIRNRKGQKNFFNKIENTPSMELRTTLLKQADGEIYQKGVDVKLATDLINFAYNDSYDIAIVLGGDSDLCECIKHVKENKSKIVIVVAYYTEGDPLLSTISDLKKYASYFINLKDLSEEEIEQMSEPLREKTKI